MEQIERLRVPEKHVESENLAVVAVDIGNEFTKAAYWNMEDNCSSVAMIDGCNSIPTAIAYSVGMLMYR